MQMKLSLHNNKMGAYASNAYSSTLFLTIKHFGNKKQGQKYMNFIFAPVIC